MTPLIGGGLILFAAAVVLAFGLRGRRVGDHRHCRKCGYDLHGQPDLGGRCSECGANLTARRATVVGLRQRRSGLVLTGVVLLMLAAWPTWKASTDLWKSVDWYHYTPASWLIKDAFAAAPDPKAYAELVRRFSSGSLQGPSLNAFFDQLLAQQASPATPWNRDWGLQIESARAAGLIDEQRWKRYVVQSVALDMRSRTRINADQPLTVFFTVTPTRRDKQPTMVHGILKNLRVDGKPVLKNDRPVLHSKFDTYGGNGGTYRNVQAGVGSDWGPGKHVIEVDVDCSWTLEKRPAADHPAVETRALTLRREFEVQPADQPLPLVEPADDALRARMRGLYQSVSASRWDNAIYVRLEAGPTPVKMVYRLQIKVGDRAYTHKFPRSIHAGDRPGASTRFDVPNASAIRAIDVIVKADPETLAKETEDTPAWGEDIVFKDVKVTQSPVPEPKR